MKGEDKIGFFTDHLGGKKSKNTKMSKTNLDCYYRERESIPRPRNLGKQTFLKCIRPPRLPGYLLANKNQMTTPEYWVTIKMCF